MYCKNCGVKNDEDAVFCISCGNPLHKSVQSSQIQPHNPQHGILFWAGLVVVSVLVIVFLAAFLLGVASGLSKTNEAEIPVATLATVTQPPIYISYAGYPDWVQYDCNEDHFRIYIPPEWTAKEMSVSDVSESLSSNDANKIDQSLTMNKVLYIFSPSQGGFITIYGADFSGKLISIFNDPSKTRISDEFYDGIISGIQSSGSTLSKDGTVQAKIVSLDKDSNYYSINGNPARHAVLHWEINGQPLDGDLYIISHDNRYYIEFYSEVSGSSQKDADTAVGIMKTLRSIPS